MLQTCPQCQSSLGTDGIEGPTGCAECGANHDRGQSMTNPDRIRPLTEACEDVEISSQPNPPFVSLLSASPLNGTSCGSALTGRFGEYALHAEIARGGMGVVYKAEHLPLHRVVALKVIRSGVLASSAERRRFEVEARSAARLRHPNIVPVYDVGQIDNQPFYSMEMIEGESLQQKLKDGPLPARDAAEILAAVAGAVQYSHERGVIHRDLKPANILLNADGEPHVTDFGLARQVQADSSLTETGQVLGTPGYMAPEQASGQTQSAGPSADVYAIGATLYCAMTGRPPFQAASIMETLDQVINRRPVPPRDLNASIPIDLQTICLKCLRKDPARRYMSAASVEEDLRRFLDGRSIHARPVSSWERMRLWCRRNPVVTALIAALIAGFSAAGFFALTANRRANELDTALQRAEDNEHRAQKLFRISLKNNLSAARMADDLKRLAGTQSEGVRRIMQHILVDYDALLTAGERTPELLNGKAKLLVAFADVQIELGRTDEAMRMIEQARSITRQLMTGNRDREVAVIHARAGNLHGLLLGLVGKPRDALRILQKTLDEWDLIVAETPDNNALRGRAECHRRLGPVWAEMGNYQRSARSNQRAIADYRNVKTDDTRQNIAIRSHLAITSENLAFAKSQQFFQSYDPLPEYNKAIEAYRRVLKESPDRSDVSKRFARLLLNTAELHGARRRYEQSRKNLNEAGVLVRRQLRHDPDSVDWKRLDLLIEFALLRLPGEMTGRSKRQARLIHEMKSLVDQTAKDHRKTPAAHRLDAVRIRLMFLRHQLTNANRSKSEIADLHRSLHQLEREAQELRNACPDVLANVTVWGAVQSARAAISARAGDRNPQIAAMQNHLKARLEFFERQHSFMPNDRGWIMGLVDARRSYAISLVLAARPSDARRQLEKATELLRGRIGADPTDDKAKQVLSSVQAILRNT